MKKILIVSCASALVLVGAGCAKSTNNSVQPVQAPTEQAAAPTAPTDAHLSFIRGSLASAGIANFTEKDEASDVAKMQTKNSIGGATKFKFTGGNGSVSLLSVSVKSAGELAAVKKEIEGQYAQLQQLATTVRIAWLPGDATHIDVLNWKSGDETFANSVIAALGGSVPAAAAAPTATNEEKLPADTEKSAAAQSVFKVGESVMGRWKGGSRWYPGKITKVSGDEVYIHYTDGTDEVLPPLNVAHLNQPNSTISIGQGVLAKWNDGNYYQGTVQAYDNTSVTVKWSDGSTPSKLPYSSVEIPGR